MRKLTIATFNTYGFPAYFDKFKLKSRYQAAAKYFNTNDIDVIHLQEVFTYYHYVILKKKLTNYPFYCYQKSLIGPKGGLVTFSKLPLAKVKYFRFSNKYIPKNMSLLEILGQKGILITKLQDENLIFINTHFKYAANEDWSKNSKYYLMMHSQIKEFQEILSNQKADVLIVTGDFNIKKSSVLYQELTNYDNLIDLYSGDNKITYYKKFQRDTKSAYCIDYIFICGKSSNYKVVNKKYLFEDKVKLQNSLGYISDHIGLVVTIET